MLLPTSRTVNPSARAQIRAPAEKKSSERRSNCCLPKTSERAAMKGWKTALVRR
jgi:hypothetical protein